MSSRVMFLTGHLTGLLLGAALVWASASNRPLIRYGRAVPPTGSNWLPSGYNSSPQRPPLRTFDWDLHPAPPAVPPTVPHAVPPTVPHAAPPVAPHDWKQREFNGQPYYLIPIDTVKRSKAT